MALCRSPLISQTLDREISAPPDTLKSGTRARPRDRAHFAVIIVALGIVYGDIGTSPLYAMSEAFYGHYPLACTAENIMGVVSLVFWSLFLVVSVKYVGLILRANNAGEGGIFALLSLLYKQERAKGGPPPGPNRPRSAFIGSILVGASLLYGDGIITPAISVLSAVEGLSIVTATARGYELLITLVILAALFMVQKKGTHRIGWLFGPIMSVWFMVIALLGIIHILKTPEIIYALNPAYAIGMVRAHGYRIFLVLGAIVLCVTGVEAMYADLGHVGRKAITDSWTFLVFPSLMLNYLGQGAYLLGGKPVPENHLFYALVPQTMLLPTVLLATAATVIASQALISGAYSLTQQGIALGLFPRIKIVHTNPKVPGQIYMPFINTVLLIGCCWLIFSFRRSTDLAAAYGIAVSGTMVVTTIAFAVVAFTVFKWRKRYLLPILVPVIIVDVVFFASNLLKFESGGYVPVLIGFAVFIVMDTWRWGRQLIGRAYQERLSQYHLTVKDIIEKPSRYIDPGLSVSIVVMASKPITEATDFVPPVLAVHYANWRRLPKHIVFLSILQTSRPAEADDTRYHAITFVRDEMSTIISVQARFGYMEQPDIRTALLALKEKRLVEIPLDPNHWLILVGAERFITPGKTLVEKLRMGLHSRLNRLAKPAIDYFGLQSDSAVVTETINL
jgi:KUP system potassium uptake protein